MYTRFPVHLVDYSGFIGCLYTDIKVSCGHELIGICGLYMAFKGYISFCHVHGNNMIHSGAISDTIAFGILR